MPFHRPKAFGLNEFMVAARRWTIQDRHRLDVHTREVALMTVIWGDLTKEEQTALKRMNRGPYPSLSKALAERLVFLGLAEERPSGTGINRTGRELVIRTLLGTRSD
jgi:hypothetical protein